MIDRDFEQFWNAIPVGEEKAAPASQIWKSLGMWARSTIQHQLASLAAEGNIYRKSRLMPIGGEEHLYYRAHSEHGK